MNYVKICPTCKESVAATPLAGILVTYQEDLTGGEIYEQGWHKKCYPPAPALLASLKQTVAALEYLFTREGYPPDASREMMQAARAAIAAARGEM